MIDTLRNCRCGFGGVKCGVWRMSRMYPGIKREKNKKRRRFYN